MKFNKPTPIYILIFLSIEKFIQHMVVTYAFAVDIRKIRASVALDYRLFLVSGFIAGLLFLSNIPFLYQRKRFSFILLFGLALFDFIGEFIAQGTLFIDITVSFLVACVILLILMIYRNSLVEEIPG